ncbi:MAG: F0F1 ATP synthase subunit B [Ruminococcaceae bacterium]|nr:F0F1 ATP synthase subunit B [Oscillospiraceae bacterium]
MQPSEIISVNIWQIVVSLLNLLIIFFILKKFLFKPVKKTIESRQAKIDEDYAQAESARADAQAEAEVLKAQLDGARGKADEILNEASALADARKKQAEAEARAEADTIIRQAKAEAELEKKKAQSEIKEQIVDVSLVLAERLVEREINEKDHHSLIDSFIENIPLGTGDEPNEK